MTLTACNKCKSFYEGLFWKCKASPLPKHFNCLYGEYVDGGYEDCKDVNVDGNCKLFELEEVKDDRA